MLERWEIKNCTSRLSWPNNRLTTNRTRSFNILTVSSCMLYTDIYGAIISEIKLLLTCCTMQRCITHCTIGANRSGEASMNSGPIAGRWVKRWRASDTKHTPRGLLTGRRVGGQTLTDRRADVLMGKWQILTMDRRELVTLPPDLIHSSWGKIWQENWGRISH